MTLAERLKAVLAIEPDTVHGAIHTVEGIRRELEPLVKEAEDLESQKNNAYSERNKVVAAMAHLAVRSGLKAGVSYDPSAEAGWTTVVFIEFPTGQASWHFPASEEDLLEGLPFLINKWDGHTTADKYSRLWKFRCTD